VSSVDVPEKINREIFMSGGPGLMMRVLLLSLKPAKLAHQNGELCTERKYIADLVSEVFDLRVALRFIQTRRDGTENVERAIASSFWRAAATLVARGRLKRVGSTKQLRFVQMIKLSR
jgi:hypothetical protein